MPTLLIHVENAEGGERETRGFAPGMIRVGRNRLNDLVLPHPAVSQFHATLGFDGARATVSAGRATNPLRCDGIEVALDAPTPLDAGSVLALGPITLRVEVSALALDDPEAAPAWLEDRFAWAEGLRVDERAATEGYRPSALRSYVEAMLPGSLGDARPNEDPLGVPVARFHEASAALIGAIRAQLQGLPPEAQGPRLHGLGVAHPPLRLVPDFMAMAAEVGVRWDEELAEHALLRWRQLAFQYGATPPSSAAELDVLVVRLVKTLSALAEGYAGLCAAFEPWSLAASSRGHAAASAGDAAGTLHWLLGAQGAHDRLVAVRQSFAELASRPALLAGAAMQGVRALLGRFDPFAMEREMAQLRGVASLDHEGFSAVWAHWRAVFRWWTENDRALHDAVFGEAFSRALTGDAGDPWG